MNLFLFYIFATVALFSAIGTASAAHMVRSVLFLVVCFLSISCLSVLIGAEYMGMTLTIVYVGSVAILFLFAIMMLKMQMNLKAALKVRNAGFLLLLLMLFGFGAYLAKKYGMLSEGNALNAAIEKGYSDVKGIGAELYTKYAMELQIVGIILLLSMIGVVYLAMDGYVVPHFVRRQSARKQIAVHSGDSVRIIYPGNRKGVSIK